MDFKALARTFLNLLVKRWLKSFFLLSFMPRTAAAICFSKAFQLSTKRTHVVFNFRAKKERLTLWKMILSLCTKYPKRLSPMKREIKLSKKRSSSNWFFCVSIYLFGPVPNINQQHFGFFSGRPHWVDVQMAHRLKIPHTFVIHTYTKPTKCHFCNKMLVGVFKQVRISLGRSVAKSWAKERKKKAAAIAIFAKKRTLNWKRLHRKRRRIN